MKNGEEQDVKVILQQSTVMCAGKTDAAATGIPPERWRYLYHERGGVEKPRELFGDCGLRGQQDADGTFKKKDRRNLL